MAVLKMAINRLFSKNYLQFFIALIALNCFMIDAQTSNAIVEVNNQSLPKIKSAVNDNLTSNSFTLASIEATGDFSTEPVTVSSENYTSSSVQPSSAITSKIESSLPFSSPSGVLNSDSDANLSVSLFLFKF